MWLTLKHTGQYRLQNNPFIMGRSIWHCRSRSVPNFWRPPTHLRPRTWSHWIQGALCPLWSPPGGASFRGERLHRVWVRAAPKHSGYCHMCSYASGLSESHCSWKSSRLSFSLGYTLESLKTHEALLSQPWLHMLNSCRFSVLLRPGSQSQKFWP